MKKILVTGIAGFIGYSLTKRFANSQYEIVGIDNINDYYDVELKYARLKDLGLELDNEENSIVNSSKYSNISFCKLDITNEDILDNLFTKYDFQYVIHLAAQAGVRYSFKYPETYIQSNIIGTFNIFELSKKHSIKHLIYASSSSVYGDNNAKILSTDMCCEAPKNIYAVSKKTNELMAYSYSSLYNMKLTGLRFFTVYGPWGRPDMAPMLFADAITSHKAIKLFNNGDMYRDFTYIDDIVDGISLVLENKSKNNYNIFNIGNSSPVNIKNFVSIIENEFCKKAIIEYLPMQQGEVKETYADISDMENSFGFSPKVDIQEGVSKFISWYKKYYEVSKCVE